jgi:hypothetical protein
MFTIDQVVNDAKRRKKKIHVLVKCDISKETFTRNFINDYIKKIKTIALGRHLTCQNIKKIQLKSNSKWK